MKARQIFIAVFLGLSVLFVIHACSKSKTTAPPAGGGTLTTVSIVNMAFPPATTIKVGDSITWVNKDGYSHTVTSDDATSFSSGNMASQSSYTFKATVAGSFPYHCNIHADMHGTLTVTQ